MVNSGNCRLLSRLMMSFCVGFLGHRRIGILTVNLACDVGDWGLRRLRDEKAAYFLFVGCRLIGRTRCFRSDGLSRLQTIWYRLCVVALVFVDRTLNEAVFAVATRFSGICA